MIKEVEPLRFHLFLFCFIKLNFSPFLLVIRSGFEPETHSLEGCCSIQLSYQTDQNKQPKNGESRISAAKVLNICETYKFSAYKIYLFTWNLVSPSLKKALICLAAAIPALMLASAVCAPIFLGVEK